MGDELGVLKAVPRDVVEIHNAAIEEKSKNATPEKSKAYIEEGHFTLLGIMGYLASYYRRYAVVK